MPIFVLAPDSFKGTLSSQQVIATMTEEILKLFPDAEIRPFPMADGGEGTLAVLRDVFDGSRRTIVEMADTCGLTLIPEYEWDPRRTSTYAFGEAIRAALHAGAEEIVLALGGSSTNDCGMGAMRALGARFLDEAGCELEGCGADLINVRTIDLAEFDHRIARTCFTALCDVDNPLLGPQGATYTFGPQKGATPEICAELEAGMASFAEVLAATFGRDERAAFGAGAAGGMGLASRLFLSARMVPGGEYLLDALGFDRLLEGADLCITGEGRADAQSAHGKAMSRVARRCRVHGVPCIAICGCLGAGAEALLGCGVSRLVPASPEPRSDPPEESVLRLRAAVREALQSLPRA
ncbi:glycerate kinase [Coriobacteriales bacterium OH1046]|nr:glycerate kinase [Coriobacteriales bacterium OH1046]